jgi:hypothetical protein
MGNKAATVQEWLALNQQELIHCPHQLGNLKISRSSCLKQRRRSAEWVFGTTPDNYILFAFEMHLKVCRQCGLGTSPPLPDNSSGTRRRRFKKMGRSPDPNLRALGKALR